MSPSSLSLPLGPCMCLCIYIFYAGPYSVLSHFGLRVGPALVHSAPLEQDLDKEVGNGEPVWSHGESYAFASATGDGAVLETDSWTSVDNHGGLQVENVTSDGAVVGYQVAGITNCSQESYAHASGSGSANALAYGLCNSSVLLDQPVSNTGTGYEREEGR